jgi:hypothetical protein
MPTIAHLEPIQTITYEPGVCNIGPAEIARRRRSGHIGVAASVVVLAVLLAVGAPHWTRLFLILTGGVAASGYLQAVLHFCAGFGSTGIYNFGAVGNIERVEDAQARRRDRVRSMQIGLLSLAIGLLVGIAAYAIPIR